MSEFTDRLDRLEAAFEAGRLSFDAVDLAPLKEWLEQNLLLGAGNFESGAIASAAINKTLLAPYHTVLQGQSLVAGEAAGTFFLWDRDEPAVGLIAVGTNRGVWWQQTAYIDPADYFIKGRTLRFRIRATVLANVASTPRTYGVALRAVTAVTSGGADIGLTAAADVSGSATATVVPGAVSRNHMESGDFDIGGAGYYSLVVKLAGASPANERVHVNAILQAHYI